MRCCSGLAVVADTVHLERPSDLPVHSKPVTDHTVAGFSHWRELVFTAGELVLALNEQKIDVVDILKSLPKERRQKLLEELMAVDHSLRLHGLKIVVVTA